MLVNLLTAPDLPQKEAWRGMACASVYISQSTVSCVVHCNVGGHCMCATAVPYCALLCYSGFGFPCAVVYSAQQRLWPSIALFGLLVLFSQHARGSDGLGDPRQPLLRERDQLGLLLVMLRLPQIKLTRLLRSLTAAYGSSRQACC